MAKILDHNAIMAKKTSDGKMKQLECDDSGNLKVAPQGAAGGDGAILDGVTNTIRATVKNYTNSKPVAMIPVDTNGDPVVSSGGDGAILDGVTPTTRATVRNYASARPLAVEQQDSSGNRLQGQKAMASSLPVVVASDQSNVPVTGPLTDTQLRASAVPVTIPVPAPISDNGSSLTVDALLSTPVGARISNGVGALIGQQAMSGSLPVAIASDQAVIPVSDNAASLTVDTPQLPASLDISNFLKIHEQGLANVRIGDGTNQVSILGRDVDPVAGSFGLAVVPMKSTRPGYQVVTSEITSVLTTGVKENLTLWHPNTLLKDVFILEIGVNVRVVQTAGTFGWELQFISAENATPGGTFANPQAFNRGDAASGLTVRQVVTGAPTTTGQLIQKASFPLPAAATPWTGGYDGFIIFMADDRESYSDAITLRSGQAEGLRITQNIAAALTVNPIFTIYVRYIERA